MTCSYMKEIERLRAENEKMVQIVCGACKSEAEQCSTCDVDKIARNVDPTAPNTTLGHMPRPSIGRAPGGDGKAVGEWFITHAEAARLHDEYVDQQRKRERKYEKEGEQ